MSPSVTAPLLLIGAPPPRIFRSTRLGARRLQRGQRRRRGLRIDFRQRAFDRAPARRHREAVGGYAVTKERGQRGAFVFRKIDCGHGGDMAKRRQRDEAAPLTLGRRLPGRVRLIVWCRRCSHRDEPPDPAELVDGTARLLR